MRQSKVNIAFFIILPRFCELEFCTPWPEQLNSDESCEHYLPIQITTQDYLNSTPSIRDSRARVVKFNVCNIKRSLGRFDSTFDDWFSLN